MTIVGEANISGKQSTPVYWTSPIASPIPLSLLPGTTGVGGGGVYYGIAGINNYGQIVSTLTTTNEFLPAYWSSPIALPTQLTLLPGYPGAIANGINNNGQIVGNFVDITTQFVPAYWCSPIALPTLLSLLPGYSYGIARGINNNGQIVGAIFNTFNTFITFVIPVYWSSPIASPVQLTLLPGYSQAIANGINNNGQIVGSLFDGNNSVSVYWSSPTASPTLLVVSPYDNASAGGINDPLTVSNICFPAGTPIATDQGSVAIEQLDPTKHTIKQQAILHITQTTTLDKYLIMFPKSSLSRGLPSQSTIMSKDHQIEFNGQLTPAYRFLDYSSEIKKVKYSGEILYNVLLAKYGTIVVNGLTCETLHPNNAVAKLCNSACSRGFKGLQSGRAAPF